MLCKVVLLAAAHAVLSASPLMVSDVEDMSITGSPGLEAPGWRCKAYTLCTTSQNCIYFSQRLGYWSTGERYMDNNAGNANPAEALRFSIAAGPASACGNPTVAVASGETIQITYDGGQTVTVYLPQFSTSDISFYIASDGATYSDQALTQLLQAAPPPMPDEPPPSSPASPPASPPTSPLASPSPTPSSGGNESARIVVEPGGQIVVGNGGILNVGQNAS